MVIFSPRDWIILVIPWKSIIKLFIYLSILYIQLEYAPSTLLWGSDIKENSFSDAGI